MPSGGGAAAGAGTGLGAIGTSLMPQIGQSPGLSETTVGCIGQWYFAAAADADEPCSTDERQPTHVEAAASRRKRASPVPIVRVACLMAFPYFPLIPPDMLPACPVAIPATAAGAPAAMSGVASRLASRRLARRRA